MYVFCVLVLIELDNLDITFATSSALLSLLATPSPPTYVKGSLTRSIAKFVPKLPSGLITDESDFDGLPAAVLNSNSPSIEGRTSKKLNLPSPFPVTSSAVSPTNLLGIVSISSMLDVVR